MIGTWLSKFVSNINVMVDCHFVTSWVIIPVVEMAKNVPKQVDEAPFIRLHTCAHLVCLFGNRLQNDA